MSVVFPQPLIPSKAIKEGLFFRQNVVVSILMVLCDRFASSLLWRHWSAHK